MTSRIIGCTDIDAYSAPSAARTLWQAASTWMPYVGLWALMIMSLDGPCWATLALSLPAGMLMGRMLSMTHDCGHGSMFRSRLANDLVGSINSFLIFMPYGYWQVEHSLHHAGNANLDRRGIGDVWTLTVNEYLASSSLRRLWYRIYRTPVMLFCVAGFFLLLVKYRFPRKGATRKERVSAIRMNLALAIYVGLMSATIGLKGWALIQFPTLMVGAGFIFWMFYLNHNYEGAIWDWDSEWEFERAAMEGSSWLKIPPVFRWFCGNSGYHHIHHVFPEIPNYNMERCLREIPLFQRVEPVDLRGSWRAMFLKLWDEDHRRLIRWDQLNSHPSNAWFESSTSLSHSPKRILLRDTPKFTGAVQEGGRR